MKFPFSIKKVRTFSLASFRTVSVHSMWVSMLVIWVLCAIGVGVFAGTLFFAISNNKALVGGPLHAGNPEVFNRDELNAVLLHLAERAERFEALKQGLPEDIPNSL